MLTSLQPLASLFPTLAQLYRTIRDRFEVEFQREGITPWGFKFYGNSAMASGDFEPVETELIRRYLAQVDIFINVGANVGYYCCHALSMEKPVIAFEPIERNLRFLFKNLQANHWNDIEIFPLALTNKIGLLDIYGGNTGASLVKGWANIPESYKTTVPCSTIDNVLQDRLKNQQALIVIDIEGAEKWLLEKAHKVLSNDSAPYWIIEIMTSEHQPNGVLINQNLIETFNIFFSYGYSAYTADKNLQPVSIEEVKSVAAGLRKFNAYNFLFSKGAIF